GTLLADEPGSKRRRGARGVREAVSRRSQVAASRGVLGHRDQRPRRPAPDANCMPMGITQFHMQPQPRKIIQTPKLIVILYEANYGQRTIYMDGRPLPKPGEPQPWWYGYSVGRW